MQKFFSRRIELGLLILAAAVFAITLVSLELSQDNALTTDLIYLIGGFIGVFTIAHLAMCFLAPYADQIMLPIVAILNGIGLIVLARLDLVNDRGLAVRQVMWTVVGLVLFVLVLAVVKDHRSLTRYSYILGAAGLVLLALPLVWPQPDGVEARIWLSGGR